MLVALLTGWHHHDEGLGAAHDDDKVILFRRATASASGRA